MIYDPSIWLKNYDPGVGPEVEIYGDSLAQIFRREGQPSLPTDRP